MCKISQICTNEWFPLNIWHDGVFPTMDSFLQTETYQESHTNSVSRNNLPTASGAQSAEITWTPFQSCRMYTQKYTRLFIYSIYTHPCGLLNLGGENLSQGELPPNLKFPKGKFTPQELPLPCKLGSYKRDMNREGIYTYNAETDLINRVANMIHIGQST